MTDTQKPEAKEQNMSNIFWKKVRASSRRIKHMMEQSDA